MTVKLVGVDQITHKNGNESSQITANQIILSPNCVKFSAIFSWSTITAELPCPLMSPFWTKIISESVSSL